PARGGDERQLTDVLRAGAARGCALHQAGAAVGERGEDHQAGHRTLLGDRRRVPQPERRPCGRRVVDRVRVPAVSDRRQAKLGGDRSELSAAEGGTTNGRRPLSVVFNDVKEGLELEPLSYDVTATTVVLGALATRDWRPQHHDFHFATERNG